MSEGEGQLPGSGDVVGWQEADELRRKRKRKKKKDNRLRQRTPDGGRVQIGKEDAGVQEPTNMPPGWSSAGEKPRQPGDSS